MGDLKSDSREPKADNIVLFGAGCYNKVLQLFSRKIARNKDAKIVDIKAFFL
jgi:hypothetical protein